VDLLTGSATSESVCWIVGRAGAILLTTDGGEHWKMLSAPQKKTLAGFAPWTRCMQRSGMRAARKHLQPATVA